MGVGVDADADAGVDVDAVGEDAKMAEVMNQAVGQTATLAVTLVMIHRSQS